MGSGGMGQITATGAATEGSRRAGRVDSVIGCGEDVHHLGATERLATVLGDLDPQSFPWQRVPDEDDPAFMATDTDAAMTQPVDGNIELCTQPTGVVVRYAPGATHSGARPVCPPGVEPTPRRVSPGAT